MLFQNYPFVSNEKKNHASWTLGPHLSHLTFGLHLYQLLNHRKSRHFISLRSEPCWYLVSRGAGLTAELLAVYCLLTETVIILTQILRREPFSSAFLIFTSSRRSFLSCSRENSGYLLRCAQHNVYDEMCPSRLRRASAVKSSRGSSVFEEQYQNNAVVAPCIIGHC